MASLERGWRTRAAIRATARLRGRVRLQAIGEACNPLNHTNFKGVNGVDGTVPIEELPAKLVGRRGPLTEPFSFASVFDPRQLQFSLRLTL